MCVRVCVCVCARARACVCVKEKERECWMTGHDLRGLRPAKDPKETKVRSERALLRVEVSSRVLRPAKRHQHTIPRHPEERDHATASP